MIIVKSGDPILDATMTELFEGVLKDVEKEGNDDE